MDVPSSNGCNLISKNGGAMGFAAQYQRIVRSHYCLIISAHNSLFHYQRAALRPDKVALVLFSILLCRLFPFGTYQTFNRDHGDS
jgi:hypothetical protein